MVWEESISSFPFQKRMRKLERVRELEGSQRRDRYPKLARSELESRVPASRLWLIVGNPEKVRLYREIIVILSWLDEIY